MSDPIINSENSDLVNITHVYSNLHSVVTRYLNDIETLGTDLIAAVKLKSNPSIQEILDLTNRCTLLVNELYDELSHDETRVVLNIKQLLNFLERILNAVLQADENSLKESVSSIRKMIGF